MKKPPKGLSGSDLFDWVCAQDGVKVYRVLPADERPRKRRAKASSRNGRRRVSRRP